MNYEIHEWSQTPDKSLTDVRMSNRLRRAIRRLGITTLAEMHRYTEADLKAQKFTRGEIREFMDIVAAGE